MAVQLQPIYSCLFLVIIVIRLAPSFHRFQANLHSSSPFSSTTTTTHAMFPSPTPSTVHHWRYAARHPVPPTRKSATSTTRTTPATCSRTDCRAGA